MVAVVVVNAALARRVWPDREAAGQCVFLSRDAGVCVRPGAALRQGLATVAAGSAAGAVAVGRLLRARLYGVAPLDPLTLGVTAAVLATAALVATWLPARRASTRRPHSAASNRPRS